MRVREFRKNIWRSLATTVRIGNRAQLVRYISAKLHKDGAPIPDALIHVTHFGYDDRIDWDEYVIVVEGFGVFGYADAPCPALASEAFAEEAKEFDEIISAFSPAQPRSLERRHTTARVTRTSRAARMTRPVRASPKAGGVEA